MPFTKIKSPRWGYNSGDVHNCKLTENGSDRNQVEAGA